VHTQKIESRGRVAKKKFKIMCGCDRKYLDSYLKEFSWRYTINNNHLEVFEKIMYLIPKHFAKVTAFNFTIRQILKITLLIQIYKYEDTDKFFELVDEDEEEGYFD
jgi:hypothetical protein